MNIIFIHGAPGVGKYSVAKELVEGKNFRLLHNHLSVNLVESVLDWGSEGFWEEVMRIRMEMIQLAIKHDVPNLILTQVIEKEDAEFIQKLKDEMSKNDVKIYFIRLVCNIDEHLKRVSNPERKVLNKMTNSEKLSEQMKNHQYDYPIDSELSYTIDNTNLTPKEVKDKILKIIRN